MRSIRAGMLSLALAVLAAACADGPAPTSPDAPFASVAGDCAALENSSPGAKPAACATGAGTDAPPAVVGVATAISEPDAAYVSSTNLIDISDLVEFAQYLSISDGVQTASFLFPMEKRVVPDSWATWSSPPYSETSTPHVLFIQPPEFGEESVQQSETIFQTIDLSERASIAGFELEPNPFSLQSFTVIFFAGSVEVGRVQRLVHGDEGARLFAIRTPGGVPGVDRVLITGSSDFSIARVRYATDYLRANDVDDAFEGLLFFLELLYDDGKLPLSQYVLLRTQVNSAQRTAERGNLERLELQMRRFLTYASARNLPAADMALIEDLVDDLLFHAGA